MPLPPGARLGPYEILAAIGAGGMGEVYRARDTKLNRDVAIKVLPSAFAQDSERMARFQREAQVLAALNHPNIAQIHGMEESALVMEFVPGDDLHGPLPLDEALAIARQIAEALEAAHEKGIVHRDLKPANIKVTPDGRVKVLDFGLAKALEETSTEVANSPTMSLMATRAGIIMGTAAYMSPEQAKGKPVDRRADIWAFGVVLCEMLTGERMYSADTASETLALVMLREPGLDKLPPETPPHVRRLLERCLRKDPRSRLRDIGEARVMLEEAPPDASTPTASLQSQPAPKSLGAWIAATVVLALALTAAGIIAWRATRPAPLHPLMRLSVEVGTDAALVRVRQNGLLALSPDGARLVVTYRGTGAAGKARLGTRLLNQSTITPLSNTEDAATPFFSPDGQWIGFQADGKLKKISVDGGAAVTICELPQLRGASWGDDGYIVLVASAGEGLSRVSSDGGKLEPLSRLDEGERTHRWPQVLPGSNAILFTTHTANSEYDDARIEALSLKTRQRKILQRGGFSGRYLNSGHLVYLHQSTLFAAPFDLKSLSITGPPVPILEDAGSTTSAGGDFAFSDTGSFVYLSGRAGSYGYSISWLDSASKRQVLHAPVGRYSTLRISPDGKRVAFALAGTDQNDIWVKDLERDTPSRLTFLAGENRYPIWTPDGRNIVFRSRGPKNPGLYWIRSDGSGEAQRLTEGKPEDTPYSFSPDGKRLAFSRIPANGLPDIWTVPIEGDPAHPSDHPRLGKAELFLGTPFVEVYPAFSPDGHWLAYASNESGTFEVYVRPFPGPGGRWQISTGGGTFPAWSRSGHELLFQRVGGNGIMAVVYTTKGETFTASTPRVWSAASLVATGNFPNYDLAPDGKRIAAFLALEDESQKPLTHLTFLLNFFDELRRKAPGRN